MVTPACLPDRLSVLVKKCTQTRADTATYIGGRRGRERERSNACIILQGRCCRSSWICEVEISLGGEETDKKGEGEGGRKNAPGGSAGCCSSSSPRATRRRGATRRCLRLGEGQPQVVGDTSPTGHHHVAGAREHAVQGPTRKVALALDGAIVLAPCKEKGEKNHIKQMDPTQARRTRG